MKPKRFYQDQDQRTQRRRQKRKREERGPISRLSRGHSGHVGTSQKCWTQKNGGQTRKRKYYRRGDAAESLNQFCQRRRLPKFLFRVYQCSHCGGYHWGRRKTTADGDLFYRD